MEDDDGIPEMPRLQAQMFSSAGPHRLLMRVKRYDAATKKYGPWKCFTDADCSIEHYHDSQTQLLNIQSCLDFPLKRGGNLRIFPKLLSDEPLERLVAEIDNDPLFRQYTIQNHNEPRLHYLLSSSDEEENTSRQEQAMIPRTPVGKGHAEGIGMMTSPTAFWGNQQTQAADFCSPQASEKCSSRAKLITPDPSQTSSSSSSQSSSSQSPKICGYNYHGVHMEPVAPMPRFPSILNVSKTLGSLARIPHFSIGGNIVLYRNGADCIGWHADDTHEEEKISCLVAVCPDVTTTGARICVHSHNESDTPKFYTQCARPLKIRTKSATGAGAKLEDGDEFIELYMFSGDAYEMDSKMQEGYVHSLPKTKRLTSQGAQDEQDLQEQRRLAIIFRHGQERMVDDSGKPAELLTAPAPITNEQRYPFGSMPEILQEGNVYSRVHLAETYAHSAVQGGISGNIAIGASAIVVSRQSKGLMEGDNFQNLTYTSRSTQGGNAMCKSFCNGNVIRVFRSSGLLNPFRTLQDHSEVQRGKTTMYRYDGLYRIEHVWETEHLQNGNERNDCPTPTKPAKGAQLYTFFLKRVGTLPRIDETLDSCNKMNDEEFCTHSKDIGTMCPLAKNEKAKILPLIWLNNLLVVPDSYIAHKLSSENVSNQCEESARNLVDSDHSMSTGQPVFASSLLCSSMEVKDQHSSEPRIVSLVNDSFKMSHIGGNEKEPRNQNKGPLFSKIWHTCHQQFSCFNHWFALCGHDNHSANVAHSPTRLKNIHQEARPMQSGIPVTNQDEECRKQETLNFTFAAHLLSTKESARKRNFPALLEKDWSNAPGKPKRRKENDFLDSCGSGLEPEEAEAQGKREIEDPTASEDQLQELELAHIGYEEEKSEIDIDCESLQSDAEASAAVAQAGQTQIVECNELPLGKNKSPGSPLSIKAKHEGLKSTDIKDDPLKHESLFEEGDHIGKHEVQSKLDFEHCGDADIEGDNVESQQFKQTTPTIKDKAKCPGDQVAEPQSQSLPDQAISLGDESGPVKTKKRKQAPSPIKEEKENSKEFPTLHEKRIRMPRLSSNSTPRRRSQGNLRPRASTLLETVDEKPRSIPRCKPKPGTKRIFKGVDELPKLYTSMFHAIGFAIWGKARRYCPAMIVSPFDLHKNGEPQTKWIEMYQKVEAKGSTEELKYLVHFPGSKTYDLVHPTDFVGYDKGLEKAKRNIKTQENAKGLKILEEDSKKLPHQRTHYSLESP